MNSTITTTKLEQYSTITRDALMQAKNAFDPQRRDSAADFYDMAQRYYDDAHYFWHTKNDLVLAFAALNYAHGWLDAGARLGLFHVSDSRLFTVDTTKKY
ncbi:TPA: DUF357 domain-containing protein [Candidatus Woesearchaeota archaeon]|nr:DUF357 domain-containing protein [Candidatus Woesearchaeota archaeon]